MAEPGPSYDGAVIETDRLRLRPHELSDFADVYALWSDDHVTRYIYDQPQTKGEVWSRLLRYRGHWALLGYGYWAVIERDTGLFMGDVGLANYRRAPASRLDDIPEAGWVMARQAHGHGFAYEAMTAALAWCDQHLEVNLTWAMITPDNAASLRLAERIGFHKTQSGLYNDKDRVIVERPRDLQGR